jgi:tRNA G18 (ribose-2'-O)-methylase SpoU
LITTIPISSINQRDLAPYRTLRQSVEHLRQGIFVAESEKVVQRLIESQFIILSVLTTPEWLEHYRSLLNARPESIQVFIAEKSFLETIVGFHLHQGIMALGKIPEPTNLNSVLTQSKPPWFCVAVDGLTNSENLGVLVRNCAAFGVHVILVGETSSSPYLRRAVRNSMGAIFKLPILHCDNLAQTLRTLNGNHQFKIFAAHPHSDENKIQQIDFSGNCCIIFGSEGSGISPNVLKVCDLAVAIPMQLGVDSINVASASAVFLYEVMRQRNRI